MGRTDPLGLCKEDTFGVTTLLGEAPLCTTHAGWQDSHYDQGGKSPFLS